MTDGKNDGKADGKNDGKADGKGEPKKQPRPVPKEPEARKMEKPAVAKVEGTADKTAKPAPAKDDRAERSVEKNPTERPRASDPVVSTSTSTGRPRAAFIEPTLQAVDALDCEAIALCLTTDMRPLAGLAGVIDWRLCGRLSDLLRSGAVTGAVREKVLIPTLGMVPSKRIFLFGWGPRAGLLDGATERFAWMVDVLQKAKVERVAVALPEPATILLGLVDEHLRKPLGDRCGVIFGPDPLMPDKDTRPIPMPASTNPG